MDKKIISVSNNTRKGVLDDDYTLYEDGTVLHEYDENTYPGGYNRKRNLNVDDLDESIKQRLYTSASEENKELVCKILKLDLK